jgi:gluconate 5-dehydrogenase
MARALGLAGASVVITGRDAGRLAEAAAQLGSLGIKAGVAAFDVSGPDAAPALAAIQAEAPIDILINNAGVQIRAPFAEQTDEAWRTMFDTHVFGAVTVTRAVAPAMAERGRGKIINICSLMSEVARPTIAPYTAAKGALKMLTKALAVEYAAHNVQVNGIAPGYFATDMNAALMADPAFDAFVKRRTPAGRWGQPAEIGGLCVFLASAASDFVTGQIIAVDGGVLAAL